MAAAGQTLNLFLEKIGAVEANATNGVVTKNANVVNIHSDADAAVTGDVNTLKLTTDANAKVVLTGAQDLTYSNGGVNSTAIVNNQIIDGGAFTGKLIVTGATGVDTITAGTNGSTITGGAGADVMTGGAGVDTFTYAAVADSVAATSGTTRTFDAIHNFTVGSDKISLSAAATTALAGTALTGGITVSTLTTATNSLASTTIADFAGLVTAIGSSKMAVSAEGGLNAYIIDLTGNTGALGTGTYLVINDATAALAATDIMIELVGASAAITADDFILA